MAPTKRSAWSPPRAPIRYSPITSSAGRRYVKSSNDEREPLFREQNRASSFAVKLRSDIRLPTSGFSGIRVESISIPKSLLRLNPHRVRQDPLEIVVAQKMTKTSAFSYYFKRRGMKGFSMILDECDVRARLQPLLRQFEKERRGQDDVDGGLSLAQAKAEIATWTDAERAPFPRDLGGAQARVPLSVLLSSPEMKIVWKQLGTAKRLKVLSELEGKTLHLFVFRQSDFMVPLPLLSLDMARGLGDEDQRLTLREAFIATKKRLAESIMQDAFVMTVNQEEEEEEDDGVTGNESADTVITIKPLKNLHWGHLASTPELINALNAPSYYFRNGRAVMPFINNRDEKVLKWQLNDCDIEELRRTRHEYLSQVFLECLQVETTSFKGKQRCILLRIPIDISKDSSSEMFHFENKQEGKTAFTSKLIKVLNFALVDEEGEPLDKFAPLHEEMPDAPCCTINFVTYDQI